MGEYLGMKRCSLWILLVLFLSIPALADQNVINSVLISKSKDDPTKYELSIDSTSTAQYKMHKDDLGVWFEIKNSTLAKNAGTIYDDVSDIDSVSVKETGRNKVNIYLQGKNVENTELLFINSLFDTKKESSQKIMLAGPVSEYQSTSYQDDLEEEGSEWSDNSFSIINLMSNVMEDLKESPAGIILTLLALLAILGIIIKTISQKMSQDSEPLIGLNNNYVKDSELFRDLNRTNALQNAQAELTKAHAKYQDYLKEKYQNQTQNQTVPKAPSIDTVKKSIALNQYQKSTTNPYSNQPVIKMNKNYTTNDSFKIPPRPRVQNNTNKIPNQSKTEFTSPYIKRTSKTIDYTPKQETKNNNMKFLESVTKIYEQSGRNDLAQGLRSSISRIK